MGHAFHRKKIITSRAHTKGTGIGYIQPVLPVVRELTAEEIAAREKKVTPRSVRRHNVYCLMGVAAWALDAWEDEILKRSGLERDFALEKLVDRALTMANTAITKCCDNSGIDVDRLIQTFDKRSATAKSCSTELASALSYVGKRLLSVFDTVEARGLSHEQQ
jgi:hypothetical protein